MKPCKNKSRRILLIIICIILAFPLMQIIFAIANPMRRPHAMAKNYVLRLTPIGTDMEDVISIVDGHRNWSMGFVNYERGFAHPSPPIGRPPSEGWDWIYFVGDKSITVRAGSYWPAALNLPTPSAWLMRTVVSIFWAFDEDGKLIEIYLLQSHAG